MALRIVLLLLIASMANASNTTPAITTDIDGDVGIGTTNPEGLLHISGTGAPRIIFEDTGNVVKYSMGITGGYFHLRDEDGDKSRLRFAGGTPLIINDSSEDVDFKVKAVGQANALFVQGSDGSIGIGTASPTSTFTVVGNVFLDGSAATPAGLIFSGEDPTLGTCTNGAVDTNSSASRIRVTFSGNNTTCAIVFPAGEWAQADDVWCHCNGDDGSGATNGCYVDVHSTTGITVKPFASQWQNGDHVEIFCDGVKAE